jgi:hypothetical protein
MALFTIWPESDATLHWSVEYPSGSYVRHSPGLNSYIDRFCYKLIKMRRFNVNSSESDPGETAVFIADPQLDGVDRIT